MSTHYEYGFDEAELGTNEQLRELQLQRMRWSLAHAYNNVPFYRKAFDAKGVHPFDLHTLDDLKHFPFTVKQDMRDNYPFAMFAVPLRDVVRVHASSGTTGKATVMGYTRGDIDVWSNVMARSIRAGGGHPGDRVHVSYGYGLFTGGLGAHYGAEQLGCMVIPMSGGQTAKQVQLILDFEPDIIMVTPSYMLNIADELERQGADPRATSLRVGIFGSEPWTDNMRDKMEERLGLHALDIYGLSEVIGPGVGMECVETKDGLTLWEDHFYPEIIDPETQEVLPDGEYGELVFTSLTKEAAPVVRYRTRDLTRLLPGTARPMRRIERIGGRSDDMLIIRGVNVFPTQVEEQVLQVEALAPYYEMHIEREGNMDTVRVRVELKVEAASTGAEARSRLIKQLQEAIKTHLGISTEIEINEPSALARSQGKAVHVFDRRKA